MNHRVFHVYRKNDHVVLVSSFAFITQDALSLNHELSDKFPESWLESLTQFDWLNKTELLKQNRLLKQTFKELFDSLVSIYKLIFLYILRINFI